MRQITYTTRRDWRDPSWTGVRSVQEGLPQSTKIQRLALFGDNIIDIEGKSVTSLLIDEVSHPQNQVFTY